MNTETMNNLTRHILWLMSVVTLLSCAGAGERARMAALLEKVEQMDLEYIPLDTVTFMEEVLDFYMSHGNEDERIRANYMMGGVYRDRGDSPMALEYYLKAVNQADTTDRNCNFQKLNRIYFQIANLYHKQFFFEREIEMLQKCMWFCRKSQEKRLEILAESYMADAYNMKGDKKKGLELCEKTTKEFLDNGFLDNAATNTSQLLDYYMDANRLEEAKKLLDSYFEAANLDGNSGTIPVQSNQIYHDLGKYYEKKGLLDSAIIAYNNLKINEDINILENAYEGLMSAYLKKGNADSACKYASLFAQANDSSISVRSLEEINRAHMLYNYSEHQKLAEEKTKESSRLKLFIAGGAFASFIVFLLIIIFYRRHRTKMRNINQQYNDTLYKYLSSLKELKKMESNHQNYLQKKHEENENLRIALSAYQENMNFEHWNSMQELLQHPIVTAMHKYACKISTPSISEWKDLGETVEKFLPAFHEKIFSPDNQLTEKEQYICILTRLRFLPSEIAALMNFSKQRVTNLRRTANRKLFKNQSTKLFDRNIYSI